MNPSHARADTVIVGAGLSGLAAGIRLAQFQSRVHLFECHTRAGGLNSYYTRGGTLVSAGLHTFTNTNPSNRKWGAGLLARSLGIPFSAFGIRPPTKPSRICLGGTVLSFDVDRACLRESVASVFPGEIGAYDALVASVERIPDPGWFGVSAAEVLGARIGNPHLVGMLLLPVLCYGGYRRDVDFGIWSLVFRSLFLDGFGAPPSMRHVVDCLVSRFAELGGHLHLGTPVSEIRVRDGVVRGVVTADGAVMEAEAVLSSAGLEESLRLAGCVGTEGAQGSGGAEGAEREERVSAVELVLGYDTPLEALGVGHTLSFLCAEDHLPETLVGDADVCLVAAVDLYDHPPEAVHQIKISRFASGAAWGDPVGYRAAKEAAAAGMERTLAGLYPGLGGGRVCFRDCFTPETIRRYTGHDGGGIYGGTRKAFDGRTPVAGLYLIGNDQGGIGIMGSMISGIVMANRHVILGGS